MKFFDSTAHSSSCAGTGCGFNPGLSRARPFAVTRPSPLDPWLQLSVKPVGRAMALRVGVVDATASASREAEAGREHGGGRERVSNELHVHASPHPRDPRVGANPQGVREREGAGV